MPAKPVIIRPGDKHEELATAKPAVCIVIKHQDMYLGVHSKKRDYKAVLPGGSIDPGESSPVAAARELFEETGYRPPMLHMCGFAVLHTGSDAQTYITDVYSFLLDDAEKVPVPQSQEPSKEYAKWVKPEELFGGPHGDVYNLGVLNEAMSFWEEQVHPALIGLSDIEGGAITQFLQGLTPKQLQKEYPELIIADQERDPYKTIRSMMSLIERLNNENTALKMRNAEFEGGEEVNRLKGLWYDEAKQAGDLREILKKMFASFALNVNTGGIVITSSSAFHMLVKDNESHLMGLMGPWHWPLGDDWRELMEAQIKKTRDAIQAAISDDLLG